jgi:uncharacterized protein (DUF305 family)
MNQAVRRALFLRIVALATIGFTLVTTTGVSAQMEGHNHGTPSPKASCDVTAMSTPMAGEEGHGDHGGTPSDAAEVEFDQLYIDMMLPHHGSIIALAEAALPVLTDPRLQQMAEAIITAQTAENEQLMAWREAWYGDPNPATDAATMELMLEAMPVGTMDEMMREMDAQFQVETFCAAVNPDLAFIQQVIPHHQVAIDASVIAVEQAEHPELAAFAEGVITAQQAEIDLLNEILAEYEAAGTPVS